MSKIPKQGPFHEYSVVYTDRAINMMSPPFQLQMKDLSAEFKTVYNADAVAFIPGSGTFAMEAVARQFGMGSNVLIVRNGYFSFRWSDIWECCALPAKTTVMMAGPVKGQEGTANPQLCPPDIDAVCAKIAAEKPQAVFVPQVETSTGIILSDAYLTRLAEAVHAVGGVLVVDAIAAGNVWVDLKAIGIDLLVTAPQKGWSGPACVGIVVLTDNGVKAVKATKPSSFSCNLPQWLDVMDKYENTDKSGPGFRYYTTLPTDSLASFHKVVQETKAVGYELTKKRMIELGARVRAGLAERGFKSVAADGFGAPGVVVVYSKHEGMVGKFKAQGLQVAGGVPLKLGEDKYTPALDMTAITFRLGLFGLDKLVNVDECVERLFTAIDSITKA